MIIIINIEIVQTLFQAGFHLLDLVDGATGGFPLLFVGFFEIVAIIYIYGRQYYIYDILSIIKSINF